MADLRPRRPHEQSHPPPPDNVASFPRSPETTPLPAAARRAVRCGSAPDNRALVMFASVGSLAIKPTHCHGPRAGRPRCDRLLVPLSGAQPPGHSMNAREPRCTGDRTAQPTAAQAFGGRRTRASPNGLVGSTHIRRRQVRPASRSPSRCATRPERNLALLFLASPARLSSGRAWQRGVLEARWTERGM